MQIPEAVLAHLPSHMTAADVAGTYADAVTGGVYPAVAAASGRLYFFVHGEPAMYVDSAQAEQFADALRGER